MLIVVVPIVQGLGDVLSNRPMRAASLLKELSRAINDSAADESAFSAIMSRNNAAQTALSDHGESLALHSPIRRWSLDTLGRAWPGWMQAQDGRSVIGEDGWVYHRPDLDWVLGSGFLDHPEAPDPRQAILAFHRDLQTLGIHLILMPVPVKPTLHPEGLARIPPPVSNTDMDRFKRWADEQGIDLYDPTQRLLAHRKHSPTYLKTDTHWRPEAMSAVAEDLAKHINSLSNAKTNDAAVSHRFDEQIVRNTGDTAHAMPNNHFAPEAVTIQRVLKQDGQPWASNENAPVVLLGDSFANIYSDPAMQWGGSAGLPEHLSRFLGLDIHAIVRNGGGANESRRLFVDHFTRHPARLPQVHVVVWQFAERDLAQATWDVIELRD